MEKRETFEKKLCMSALRVTHALYEREHHCDAGGGADSARLVLAVHGEAEIRTSGSCLHISAEEACALFYIPEGAQYHIIWSGTPDIEYYIFGIVSRSFDTENITRYAIQKIEGLDAAWLYEQFSGICRLFEAGDRISKVRAIGMYYTFYAEILPYLKPIPTRHYHSAVMQAMDWIEAHYAEDFSMETLAQTICVSTSRLFHLFRSELDTTPVRYRCAVRVRHAAADLRCGQYSLEETAERNGFHSSAYFREMFKRETGLTPTEYADIMKE